MQYSEQTLRKLFRRIEFNGHSTEAKVQDASALSALLTENRVRIRADHGDALGFALNREDARGSGP